MPIIKQFQKALSKCRGGKVEDKTANAAPRDDRHSNDAFINGRETRAAATLNQRWTLTQSRLMKGISNRFRALTKSTRIVCLPTQMEVLRYAVLAQRDAESTQYDLHTKLDTLDDRVDYLNDKIQHLEARIEMLTREAKPGFEARVARARSAINMVRDTSYELQDRRCEVFEELVAVRAKTQTGQPELLEVIEDVLIRNRIIPERVDNVADPRALAANPGPITQQLNRTISPNKNQNRSRHKPMLPSRRSRASQDLRATATGPPASEPAYEETEKFLLGPKEQADWDYRTRKLNLGQWEVNFYSREDTFDKEHDELAQGLANGSRMTTVSELDRRHILDTQRLAQGLANAEEEFYAAKEAAVAAGVDFGSEAESGFASRLDDGYTLSMEVDGEMFADRVRITKWVESLPGYFSYGDVRRAAVEESLAHDDRPDDESVEDEDVCVELESVDLCDTRSAIAEGPWRRRIDKWNLMRRRETLEGLHGRGRELTME